MKRIAIAELEGAALDWAVAMAAGERDIAVSSSTRPPFVIRFEHEPWPGADDGYMPYSPSADWSQCGPLIERYKVEMCFLDGFGWTANIQYGPEFSFYASPLIAACRAIVAAHNPDGFVEVPDKLIQETGA